MLTRDEFERTIKLVDDELKSRHVPIHQRPTAALMEIAKLLNVQELIPLSTDAVDSEDFSPSALGKQVHAWYSQHYGNRLNVDMRLGSILVSIRGDPWEMVLFRAWGQIVLVCDSATLGDRRQRGAPGGGAIYNVLNSIVDLPQHLANSLSGNERVELLTAYRDNFRMLSSVDQVREAPFVPEALTDLVESVRCVMDGQAHGQSKWASLQFSEKLMKSRLQTAGVPFGRNHFLERLGGLVGQLGHKVDGAELLLISCPAAVRYGEVDVSRDEAVGAHQAALRVARSLGFGAEQGR